MAIKKSELYSTLWASCDELRGGMDASQYKDYVLVLLFIKYISDKYAGQPFAPITVPAGASFKDMVALKGTPNIGDDINKKIIEPIATANRIAKLPNFNDDTMLGSGKEKVDRLSNLIAIFENPALDFSKNRADGDDILGDAYEYLMKHFATESGKSKGQFYTPAEVSRIIAKIIGVSHNAGPSTTIYDPACGSGSLLLKVADEADQAVTLFGQEKDNATASLARMNMILHNNPTAEIKQGNSIANPLFLENETRLQTFDYVVANPPFSDKAWTNGIDPANDRFDRFLGFGVPPAKNGDYAFLLHIVRSMKRTGKGAVILPHGVLFRGNAEAEIRKNLLLKGYIKGIIGLPANLFYGTGIPACIIVLDKKKADTRQAVFMIDAGKDFIKDGNKNRLREQDIHKIVDVFNKQIELPKYSRLVPLDEIKQNEFNLNIPRYIDSQEAEDVQDIAAHLLGGIPNTDIDALNEFWQVCPSLKAQLFGAGKRAGYSDLKVNKADIRHTIFAHPEFVALQQQMAAVLEVWKTATARLANELEVNCKPKAVIHQVSENLLTAFSNKPLLDKYDIYQHLMSYWEATMKDDLYELSADGWKAGNEVSRLKKESKKGAKEVEGLEGLEGRLIPPGLLIETAFAAEQADINTLLNQKEAAIARMEELKEEHGTEEGLLAEATDDNGKISKKTVQARIKALGKAHADNREELAVLNQYLDLLEEETRLHAEIKTAQKALETAVERKYALLTEQEIRHIVIMQKWLAEVSRQINGEIERISHRLANRIKQLAERYEAPLPELSETVSQLEEKVHAHLQKMGFTWN
ncbi:MAG: type I restriction-modification system subunit M [Saprospiraceae bacterium]|nr:type I restriction-modification system subunit M [Saprospiraceae bacterium]